MRAWLRTFASALPVLVCGSAICGCARWAVIRQATPDPFGPQTQLAVDNTRFDDLLVAHVPEAQYLAQHPAEAQSFQNDKLEFLAGLSTGIAAQRGALDIAGPEALAGRYVIHTHVESIEPGAYDHLIRTPTQMRVRVNIGDPAGQPLDAIELSCSVPADAYRPALGMRIAECGRIVGANVARYLRQRTGAR